MKNAYVCESTSKISIDHIYSLSGDFSARQAQREVVKIKNLDFSYLLGLKYTLRTCFESQKFLPKSCPELSN